jgi:hypothetical protein
MHLMTARAYSHDTTEAVATQPDQAAIRSALAKFLDARKEFAAHSDDDENQDLCREYHDARTLLEELVPAVLKAKGIDEVPAAVVLPDGSMIAVRLEPEYFDDPGPADDRYCEKVVFTVVEANRVIRL